jgi:hypothetical protein
MARHFCRLLLLGTAFFYLISPAAAVVKAVTPLKVFLDDSNVIFLAKIDKFYPEKPALVLNVLEDLKGKASYRRLPVVV